MRALEAETHGGATSLTGIAGLAKGHSADGVTRVPVSTGVHTMAVETVVAHRDGPPKRGTMMRYMLRVYRGMTYYPDKQVQSHSLGRLERRAQQLEREGYRVKLLAITAAGPVDATLIFGGAAVGWSG